VQEVKTILRDYNGKWAESGSVRWAFELVGGEEGWKAKFPQDISEEDALKLGKLVEMLEENDDVQNVYTNAQ